MSNEHSTVHLHLREGFAGDEVEVQVAGQAVQRKGGVKTRMQLGLALMWPLQVPPGKLMLRLALPGRGLQAELALPAARPLWVAASVESDPAGNGPVLLLRAQTEPLGYV